MRVLTPLTYASWMTATRARSARRRGSSSQSGKYEPVRSLGIASSSAPTRLSNEPRPVAVALAEALGRPLVRAGAQPLGHVGLHELLDRPAQGLAEHVGFGRAGGLFETGEQCHPLVGHRGGLLS